MQLLEVFKKFFPGVLALCVVGFCYSTLKFERTLLTRSLDVGSIERTAQDFTEPFDGEYYPTTSPRDVGNNTVIRFARRLELLHRRCPSESVYSYRRNHWVPVPHFLVDVPKHLLVCVVPKAGSSTWHGMIWSLRRRRAGLSVDQKYYTANDTIENHSMAKKLSKEDGTLLGTHSEGDDDLFNEPREGASNRLILARHPFARLISGWKDKFKVGSNYGNKLFVRFPLLNRYKRKPPPQNFTIHFSDFARYVAEQGHKPSALDYHFKPANYLCKPCEYSYNYILKAERADDDQTWLLRRLNLTDVNLVRRGVSENTLLKRNPSLLIREKFADLKKSTIKKLYLIYQKDFYYFGYKFNFDNLESGGFD